MFLMAIIRIISTYQPNRKQDDMERKDLQEKLDNAKIGEKIVLEGFRYSFVRFDLRDYGDGIDEYSWVSERTEGYGRGYIFPSQSNPNLIKTFKTLNGAKRNFMRHVSFALEDQQKAG